MKKQFRLKRRDAFSYVYRKGEYHKSKHFVLLVAKSREGLKIGLSVSKKVGNAVVRNKTKRLLREGILPILNRIDAKYMYVLRAYPNIVGVSYQEIRDELHEVFDKAGRLTK